MKRFMTLILLAVMLLNLFAVTACAELENNTRASNYFDYYGVRLSEQENGRIKIVFSVGGTGFCDSIGVATYNVEMLNENGQWVNVSGLLNGKTASNVTSYTFSKYFYGEVGESYRVNAVFICTIGNGSETKTFTSAGT